jgi:hypothetical protein
VLPASQVATPVSPVCAVVWCHQVPEGFSQSCMEALLSYVYHDALPDGLEPPAVVELLHAASYYGTPRWEPALAAATQ